MCESLFEVMNQLYASFHQFKLGESFSFSIPYFCREALAGWDQPVREPNKHKENAEGCSEKQRIFFDFFRMLFNPQQK